MDNKFLSGKHCQSLVREIILILNYLKNINLTLYQSRIENYMQKNIEYVF
jgi:hypothetical protein